jgi:hypothetical protein
MDPSPVCVNSAQSNLQFDRRLAVVVVAVTTSPYGGERYLHLRLIVERD